MRGFRGIWCVHCGESSWCHCSVADIWAVNPRVMWGPVLILLNEAQGSETPRRQSNSELLTGKEGKLALAIVQPPSKQNRIDASGVDYGEGYRSKTVEDLGTLIEGSGT